MKKWITLLGSVIIITLLLVVVGCSNKVKPGVAEVDRAIVTNVTIAEIRPQIVDDYNEISGTIKAKNMSVIASKVMGMITTIAVKEGDRVSAGQTLLTIDAGDALPRVSAAEAGYREALKALEMAQQVKVLTNTTQERYRQLYNENAISQLQMDQVATQGKVAELDFQRVKESVSRAQAGLAEAQAYYGFTQVLAPTSGVITTKKVDSGSMAVPGVPLLILEDDSSYVLETDIDESMAGKIFLGMTADIMIDSLGKSLQGRVIEMAPTVDSATRKLHIKIDVSGAGLKSGLYAHVKISTNKKETLLVPKKAIVEKGQLTGVYAVDDKGLVLYRIVRMGKSYNDQSEILSGINSGDKVIIGGVEKAVDGGVVKEVTNQ